MNLNCHYQHHHHHHHHLYRRRKHCRLQRCCIITITITIIITITIMSSSSSSSHDFRYGLTCRQGLAPGNMLTTRGTTISSSSQTAVKSTTARGEGEKSSVFGYVTHRTNNLQQQQHLQESLPSQHEPEDRGSSRPKSVKRESEALPFRVSVYRGAFFFHDIVCSSFLFVIMFVLASCPPTLFCPGVCYVTCTEI
jgi:hypothetical protein